MEIIEFLCKLTLWAAIISTVGAVLIFIYLGIKKLFDE